MSSNPTLPDLKQIRTIIRNILDGKLNCSGSVTLTASVATTTITDPRISVGSEIILWPTSANAAAEVGNGTIYTSAKARKSATLTHANNAQSDRSFDYIVIG